MEKSIDKQKLLRSQDQPMLLKDNAQAREQNQFLDSALQMKEFNEKLQKSKWSWRLSDKDNEGMANVKNSMQALTDFMDTEMAADEEQFEKQLDALTGIYETLEENCWEYLQSHKNPWTSSGIERKRMVNMQYKSAKKELLLLKQKAYELRKLAGSGDKQERITPIWANVLGAARMVQVNIDQTRTRKIEGGTKEVSVLKLNGQKHYYKQDEKLLSPKQEYEQKFLKEAKSDREKQLLTRLNACLTNNSLNLSTKAFTSKDVIRLLKSPEKKNWASAAELISSTFALFDKTDMMDVFDWKDPQVLEMLHKVLPEYSSWLTKYDMYSSAKINTGILLSDRNIATSRLAKLLGLGDLVAESSKVAAEENGSINGGIIIKQASGVNMDQLSQGGKNDVLYTPEASRKLSMLQLFDVLCGQVNRNSSNIRYTAELIEENEKKSVYRITDIQGIDNDMAFGELSWKDVTKNEKGLFNMVCPEKNGQCLLPAIDHDMAAALEALDPEQLWLELKDILSGKELYALEERFRGMKEMLKQNSGLVIRKDNWDKTVLDKFNNSGNQPPNAYCLLSGQQIDHQYYEKKPEIGEVARVMDEIDKQLKDLTFEEKIKKFTSYMTVIDVTLESYKFTPIFETAIENEYESIVNTEFLDALAAERVNLVGKVIEQYTKYLSREIPTAYLQKNADAKSKEAHEEYAELLLRNDENMLFLDNLNRVVASFAMRADKTEDGMTYSPGEYLTELIKDGMEKLKTGVDHDRMDEILSLKPAKDFQHIKPLFVEKEDNKRFENEEKNVQSILRDIFEKDVKAENESIA